jgi:hypothetical protein
MAVKELTPQGKEKLVRAAKALNMAESGRFRRSSQSCFASPGMKNGTLTTMSWTR